MNTIGYLRRWIVPSAFAASLLLVAGAFTLVVFSDATAVDRQYVTEWLANQQVGLQSGKQSGVYFYETRSTDDLLREFASNPEITSLTFELTDLSDDGMRTICELPNIERLTLYGGVRRVGDRGLGFLRGNKSLTTLKLVNIDVTDHGLAALRTIPRLHHLTLYRDGFRKKLLTDHAVAELKQLTGLTKLNIAGGWMSQSGIHELQVSLPDCEVVVDANWIKDDG